MTREEAIKEWIIPALKNTWNEKKNAEILKALEQESCDKYIKEIDHLRKYIYKLETQIVEQKPCEDAISRAEVLDLIDSKDPNYEVRHFKEDVECLDPISVAKKTGRWISFVAQGEVDGQIVRTFTCSECGAISIFRVTGGKIVNGDLCPNCGSRMMEVEE